MSDAPAQAPPTPELALIEHTWEALLRGGIDALEGALAPDARWLGVDDAPGCQSRRDILAMLARHRGDMLRGHVEQTIQRGQRVLVAFRPHRPDPEGRPLEDGIAWVVVTVRDGVIVELKGCVDKAHALAYAGPAAPPGRSA